MLKPFVWFFLAVCVPASAAEVQVDATRRGDAIEIVASARLPADLGTAWRVLTDYDRYREFIPDLTSSRVVSRRGGSVLVEQKGDARFLFLSRPMEVTMTVAETPFRTVRSHAVGGSFRELAGEYELRSVPGAVRLVYTGRLVPQADAGPQWLALLAVRSSVERQFGALVDEINRRSEPAWTARHH